MKQMTAHAEQKAERTASIMVASMVVSMMDMVGHQEVVCSVVLV